MSLGAYPAVTIDEARTAAAEARKLAKAGTNRPTFAKPSAPRSTSRK